MPNDKFKWRLLCLVSIIKILKYHSDVTQLVYMQSHDSFRPIPCEQKYLMNYNYNILFNYFKIFELHSDFLIQSISK